MSITFEQSLPEQTSVLQHDRLTYEARKLAALCDRPALIKLRELAIAYAWDSEVKQVLPNFGLWDITSSGHSRNYPISPKAGGENHWFRIPIMSTYGQVTVDLQPLFEPNLEPNLEDGLLFVRSFGGFRAGIMPGIRVLWQEPDGSAYPPRYLTTFKMPDNVDLEAVALPFEPLTTEV